METFGSGAEDVVHCIASVVRTMARCLVRCGGPTAYLGEARGHTIHTSEL